MQLAEWLEKRIVERRFNAEFEPLRSLEDRVFTLTDGLAKLGLLETRMRAEQMMGTPGRPFVFMAGAGISNPPVLLASEIIKECMAKAGRATESADYATALGIAFPNEDQRQGYFMQLIAGKYVSNGNFRLAHLLTAKKNDKCFANVVVTTNFDDFLTRALTIFGDVPRVYPSAQVLKGKTLGGGSDIEIYHVHGSSQSYDIANLNTEVNQRAKEWRDVLSRLLPVVTPIVVGYAGQDSGAFMMALQSCLESESPRTESQARGKEGAVDPRVFWFCYRQVDLERLPPWLLKNKSVVFITPDIAPAEAPDQLRDFYRGAPTYNEKASIAHSLPSTQVFDAMIRQWNVPEPQLVREPAQALAGLLDKMLPPENVGNRYRKQYFLRRIVRQLQRFAESKPDAWEGSVQGVLSNIRVSQYQTALQLGQNLWNDRLKAALAAKPLPTSALYCACDLMDAFWSITFGFTIPDKQNLLEFEAYTLCIEVAETLIAVNKRSTPRKPSELREQLLNARLHRAVWLTEVTSATDDIAAKNELDPVAEFRDIFKRRARKFPVQASWALLNCGFVFANRGREAATAVANPKGDTKLLVEAAKCFKRVYTRYSPDIAGAAHRDGLIDPWLKAGCNLAIVYVERKDFKSAKAIAEAVERAADPDISKADTGAIRDKAARIEAHCAHELVQRAPKLRRRKSAPDAVS